MRVRIVSSVAFLALGLAAQPLTGQVDLTDNRTDEQKWARAVVFANFSFAGMIALGREADMTAEEVGKFFGEWGAPSWGAPGDTSLTEFMWWYHRNFNVYRGLEFELLSESESEIRGRMNTPYGGFFGDDRQVYGVSLEEFRTAYLVAYEVIADYLGFDLTHEVDGDSIEFALKTR